MLVQRRQYRGQRAQQRRGRHTRRICVRGPGGGLFDGHRGRAMHAALPGRACRSLGSGRRGRVALPTRPPTPGPRRTWRQAGRLGGAPAGEAAASLGHQQERQLAAQLLQEVGSRRQRRVAVLLRPRGCADGQRQHARWQQRPEPGPLQLGPARAGSPICVSCHGRIRESRQEHLGQRGPPAPPSELEANGCSPSTAVRCRADRGSAVPAACSPDCVGAVGAAGVRTDDFVHSAVQAGRRLGGESLGPACGHALAVRPPAALTGVCRPASAARAVAPLLFRKLHFGLDLLSSLHHSRWGTVGQSPAAAPRAPRQRPSSPVPAALPTMRQGHGSPPSRNAARPPLRVAWPPLARRPAPRPARAAGIPSLPDAPA